MNRNRIFLFAGLGILATCVSILAAKKYRKSNSRWVNRDENFTGAPEMRSFGGAVK